MSINAKLFGNATTRNEDGTFTTTPVNSQLPAKFEWSNVVRDSIKQVAQSAISYGVQKAFEVKGATWNFREVAATAFGSALGNNIVGQIKFSRYSEEFGVSELSAPNQQRYMESREQGLSKEDAMLKVIGPVDMSNVDLSKGIITASGLGYNNGYGKGGARLLSSGEIQWNESPYATTSDEDIRFLTPGIEKQGPASNTIGEFQAQIKALAETIKVKSIETAKSLDKLDSATPFKLKSPFSEFSLADNAILVGGGVTSLLDALEPLALSVDLLEGLKEATWKTVISGGDTEALDGFVNKLKAHGGKAVESAVNVISKFDLGKVVDSSKELFRLALGSGDRDAQFTLARLGGGIVLGVGGIALGQAGGALKVVESLSGLGTKLNPAKLKRWLTKNIPEYRVEWTPVKRTGFGRQEGSVGGFKIVKVPNKADEIARLSNSLEFRKRSLELSLDPDRGQLLVREGIGAARFEQATGRTVLRSTDGATDFIDPKLGAFDLKGPLRANDGSPIDITPKRVEGLGNSIIKEVNNSTASKAVVVDTLGLTKEQISLLKAQVSNGTKNTKPIIYVE